MNAKEIIESIDVEEVLNSPGADAIIEAKLGVLRDVDEVLFRRIAVPTNVIIMNIRAWKKVALETIDELP